MRKQRLLFDEIGQWSEIKLEIVRKYAQAYSTILAKQRGFRHYYIDGFAGAGVHISRATGEWIPGSPLNALLIRPTFRHYYLVDLDGGRIKHLHKIIGERPYVTLREGDCNRTLAHDVLPQISHRLHRRALCLLDPYGLQLDWNVVRLAGELKTIDLFLNFPIMAINRTALWTRPERVSPVMAGLLTTFWGDETWRQAAYHPSAQGDLFGREQLEKLTNGAVVAAFRSRLRDVAGFKNVPEPMPMRNDAGGIVYYLFFASQNDTANRIVLDIFTRYAAR